MSFTGCQQIGAEESCAGDQSFQAVNPADGSHLPGEFKCATAEEIDRAADLAASAAAAVRAVSLEQRAAFLDACADEIMALGQDLGDRYMAETGLPQGRFEGERGRTCGQLKMFARYVKDGSWLDAKIDHADPDRKPFAKPDVRSMRQPIGPVVVFGASNFPLAFATSGGDAASAMASGCPIIVKAHPSHPGTAELIGRAILAAAAKTGMPNGVFSQLQDSGIESGKQLAMHPAVKAIGFTGSLRGGRALFDLAASRPDPIPVFAEMGSTNPMFVLPEAMAERAEAIGKGLGGSVLLGVGQFCTCPGIVLGLPGAGWTDLVEATSASVQGGGAATMLNAGIKQNFVAGLDRLTAAGASLASGEAQPDGCAASGAVFITTGSDMLDDPALEEEVFGPSTLFVECTSEEQMLDVARGLSGHLSATIHGTDADLAANSELIDILTEKAGRLVFNDYPTGVEVNHAIVHGGPYPATTDSRTTSVGSASIERFLRPVCWQDFPDSALPDALKDSNPLGLWRVVDGVRTRQR
jgi:NADP-dependent aldehyde dehydrogenase